MSVLGSRICQLWLWPVLDEGRAKALATTIHLELTLKICFLLFNILFIIASYQVKM